MAKQSLNGLNRQHTEAQVEFSWLQLQLLRRGLPTSQVTLHLSFQMCDWLGRTSNCRHLDNSHTATPTHTHAHTEKYKEDRETATAVTELHFHCKVSFGYFTGFYLCIAVNQLNSACHNDKRVYYSFYNSLVKSVFGPFGPFGCITFSGHWKTNHLTALLPVLVIHPEALSLLASPPAAITSRPPSPSCSGLIHMALGQVAC